MPNPTRIEVNCTTGETVEIELTDAEVAELQAQGEAEIERQAEAAAAKAALEAVKTSARAKLIAGQPLTEEEASVLVI